MNEPTEPTYGTLEPRDYILIIGDCPNISPLKAAMIIITTGIPAVYAVDGSGNTLTEATRYDAVGIRSFGSGQEEDVLKLQEKYSFLLFECDFQNLEGFKPEKHFFVKRFSVTTAADGDEYRLEAELVPLTEAREILKKTSES